MEAKAKYVAKFGVLGLFVCCSMLKAKGQTENRSNFVFGKEPKTVIAERADKANNKSGMNVKFTKSPKTVSSRMSDGLSSSKPVVTFGKEPNAIRQRLNNK